MIRCCLVLASLFVALPAAAEFTAAEKASVHKFYLASQHLPQALYRLERATWTGEAASTDPEIAQRISGGGVELWYSIAILANDDILQSNYGYVTRDEHVQVAMYRRDSVINQLTQALALLPPPCNFCGSDLQYAAWYVDLALARVLEFDATLPYTDYEPITSQGFPRMFGPHGNWPAAQASLSDTAQQVFRWSDNGMTAHVEFQQYGFAWRIKQALTRISDAYFAAWGHGDFGPDEATMRALVETKSPIASGFNLETLVGFFEFQKIHQQQGEVGATHHFPYMISNTFDCVGGVCPAVSAEQAQVAKELGFAWRTLDDWSFQFAMIHFPPNSPSSDPCGAADVNRDGALNIEDLAQVVSCAVHGSPTVDDFDACAADFDMNGVVGAGDISTFISAYGNGVCEVEDSGQ